MSGSSFTTPKASAAEISAETAVNKYIPPDLLNNSKRVVKAWALFTYSKSGSVFYTLISSFNISSFNFMQLTFTNAMSTTNYAVFAMEEGSPPAQIDFTKATGTLLISNARNSGTMAICVFE